MNLKLITLYFAVILVIFAIIIGIGIGLDAILGIQRIDFTKKINLRLDFCFYGQLFLVILTAVLTVNFFDKGLIGLTPMLVIMGINILGIVTMTVILLIIGHGQWIDCFKIFIEALKDGRA